MWSRMLSLAQELSMVGTCRSNRFLKGLFLKMFALILIMLSGLFFCGTSFFQDAPSGRKAEAM